MSVRAGWIERYVAEHCFTPATGPLTFGAELELLAFDARNHRIAPIFPAANSSCTLDVVREVCKRLAWCETLSDKGVPKFVAGGGGSLTFEPGGQLEYASAVHHSVDAVLHELCTVESVLRESAGVYDIELLAVGVDPFNEATDASLQLTADRYSRMAAYFATIGDDGARMMRQTASLQINIGGIPTIDRWAVANAVVPWLVALFANSSIHAGQDTGFASFRAETWRGVDPSRTGTIAGDDPVAAYSGFARNARAFLASGSAPRYGDLASSLVTDESLKTHLSTLFPEVRPRGYLEFRSMDSLPASRRAAAMAFVVGIVADETAAKEALARIGPPTETMLRQAGQNGQADPAIGAHVDALIGIARQGCIRLGEEIISADAWNSLEQLTRQAR